MMKPYQYIRSLILAFAVLSLSACSNDDYLLQTEGESVSITFRPTLGSELNTRAIGDATGIDRLTVAVYEGTQTLSKKFSFSEEWDIVKRNGIALTLIEGHSYKILFWAENSENSAYNITDDGRVVVDYDDYINGGFAKMEEMDAFFGISSITVGSQKIENNGEIKLSRPLAQLNFADNATQPEVGTHKTIVTFHGIASSFNPFTGAVEMSNTDQAFVFTDFPTETLMVEGSTYYYLSSNYLFAPQTGTVNISATIDVQNTDGTSIKTIELSGITLEKNKKTNVTGSIVQQPETWSVWDGVSKSQPTTDAQNRYIIDDAADIAWLCENGLGLNANSSFLQTKDIDMSDKTIASIKLPVGSTYDGGGKTIKNFANSLFGDATSLIVKDLTVENITVSGSTHIGTLVNTLKGSSSFTNVSVTNASATTTSGAAGGMVGNIVRTTEKDRDETLNVSFTGCKLNSVSVSGSASEGKFVGLLSGYDSNESLSFDAECDATEVSVSDYISVYTKANNSAWVNGDVTNKYDGWLGHETYRRAKVTFGGVRLAPRWDGTTATAKADLLLYNGESNKYEIHSPFDLAGVRNATASPAALYLMENVDMYGQGADEKYNVPSNWTQSAYVSKDDNYFKSFSTIAYLDGNSYGIYNLNINTQKVSTTLYYGGFIQSSSGTTTHKNIKFHSSCVVVPLVVASNEDKGSAGMLISNIAGTSYTMENIHTYGCKIFALQKVGGIAARMAATNSTISNCSVNNGYIENYECKDHKENFSKTASGVTVSGSFYSHGEVGGMFGFVEQNASIENCRVNGTTIYAFGEDDLTATLKGSGLTGNLAVLALKALGYYKIPGRHVGTFIGNIRTNASGGGTITMTNVSVDAESKCTKQRDKHNNVCPTVGRAYFVAYGDDEGEVYYNGTKLKLMDCKTSQNRDQ